MKESKNIDVSSNIKIPEHVKTEIEINSRYSNESNSKSEKRDSLNNGSIRTKHHNAVLPSIKEQLSQMSSGNNIQPPPSIANPPPPQSFSPYILPLQNPQNNLAINAPMPYLQRSQMVAKDYSKIRSVAK